MGFLEQGWRLHRSILIFAIIGLAKAQVVPSFQAPKISEKSKKAEQKPESEPAPPRSQFSFFESLPPGTTVKNLRVPQYENLKLASFFTAKEARVLDAERVSANSVYAFQFSNETKSETTALWFEAADYNTKLQFLAGFHKGKLLITSDPAEMKKFIPTALAIATILQAVGDQSSATTSSTIPNLPGQSRTVEWNDGMTFDYATNQVFLKKDVRIIQPALPERQGIGPSGKPEKLSAQVGFDVFCTDSLLAILHVKPVPAAAQAKTPANAEQKSYDGVNYMKAIGNVVVKLQNPQTGQLQEIRGDEVTYDAAKEEVMILGKKQTYDDGQNRMESHGPYILFSGVKLATVDKSKGENPPMFTRIFIPPGSKTKTTLSQLQKQSDKKKPAAQKQKSR